MDEFKPVLEFIDKGCYTIADLTDRFRDFDASELEESLEGFVLFKKIKKTRQYFHGNNIIPPEKKIRTTTGNSLDLTQIDYPDWVVTDRDKIKFLTSPESPKIAKPMNFFIDDVDLKTTGKLLFDSLNSNHIMTSIFLSPRTNEPGNKIDYSKDVTQPRGFSVFVKNGKFRISVSLLMPLRLKYANAKTEAVPDHFEAEFNSFEEFKKWIVENL
jgi:hypothetical protein